MLNCFENSIGFLINCWVVEFNAFERGTHKGDGYFVVLGILLSKDCGIGMIRRKSIECKILREVRAHERHSVYYGLLYGIKSLILCGSPVILGVFLNQVM
jgi:hypothetical protein